MIETDLDAVVAFIGDRLDVSVLVASAENGAPEVAWGDVFFYAGPFNGDDPPQRMPFATIVTKDYPGFDEASDLDRPGVFRLNVGIGRSAFAEKFPGWPGDDEFDFTVSDVLVPHPVYWPQFWLSVINPSQSSLEQIEPLLVKAHRRADDRRTSS